MKKAVIFDFGQTLADSARGFRTAEKEAEAELFSYLRLTSWDDFILLYRKVRKAFHERSDFSRSALWARVCEHYGTEAAPAFLEECEESYWDTVQNQTFLFPETLDTLEKLSLACRLALITNTQGQKNTGKHRISLFPDLDRFFRVVVVAGEAGIPAKPDPSPFLVCLERLGIEPSEAVYVGDDWRIDICGARNAGIDPVWLQHRSVTRSWPDVVESAPVITSLDRLFDLENTILCE